MSRETHVDHTQTYRSVAVLLAAASTLTESPSLIDRMANALNPEPAARAVYDALRIVESDQKSNNPRIKNEKDERGRPYLSIGDKKIFGWIPTSETVRKFIENVCTDVSIARKIGTFASALLVEAYISRQPAEGD
ncbi:MAG: hypothetical protein QXK61_08440 [Nitrososphaerota archaeon]